MLGFYSDSHHAIFTHYRQISTYTLRQQTAPLLAYADGFVLGSGMRLLLPKN